MSSQPDVFVDPIPPARPLVRPRALSPKNAMRHSSAVYRPTRVIDPLPAFDSFHADTVIMYHRNDVRDLINGVSSINMTLTQQGNPIK